MIHPGVSLEITKTDEIEGEGLHAKSDDDCLSYAETCRKILVFLVNQVTASKARSKEFTEGMKTLLAKKSKKTSQQ